jgi:hypothetical protein
MSTGLLCLLAANLGATLGARALSRRFVTPDAASGLTVFLLLRILLITVAVASFGAVGWLRPLPLGAAGLAAAVLLRGEWRGLRPAGPWPLKDPSFWLLAVLAVRVAVHAAIMTPFMGDAVSYQLPKVAEWIQKGRLWVDPGPDARAWFPAGFELVEAWWAVFLHHDAMIELAGAEFLALGAAATASLAGHFGLTASGARLAAASWLAAPAVLLPSTYCLNDGAVAAILATAASFLLRSAPPPLTVCALGLGLGVKPIVGFALPGLLLLLRGAKGAAAAPRGAWGLAALALLAGALWYGRNAVVHGNPFYPAFTDALKFGNESVHGAPGPGLGKLVRNLGQLVDGRWMDERRPYNAMLEEALGWGPALMAIGIPGLLWKLGNSAAWRLPAAGFGVSFLCVLAFAEVDRWNLRFVAFAAALVAVAAAALASEFRPIRLGLLTLLAFLSIATIPTENADIHVLRARLAGRSITDEFVPPRSDGRVGCYGDVSSMVYLLYGSDYSREVVYFRPVSSRDLVEGLRSRGLSSLYAYSAVDRLGWGDRLQEAVLAGALEASPGQPWYRLRSP